MRVLFTLLFCFFVLALQGQSKSCAPKKKPYYEVWGYPKAIEMKLIDREYSQSVHFGFALSVNTFDFFNIKMSKQTVNVPNQGNMELYAVVKKTMPGFNLNSIMDYRLVRNLNIRFLPGIFFGQREVSYFRTDNNSPIEPLLITSNYLDFPLLLKYSAMRFNNFRPYIIAGINPRVNLSNKVNESAKRYIGLKVIEPFAEVGFGFDFYFDYFRMGTEIKFSGGLQNALNDQRVIGQEHYRDALKSLQSNMLILSLSFEL